MLCRNCNYILSGEEAFCPHCGQALKEKEIKTNEDESSVPLSTLPRARVSSTIFDSEITDSEEEAVKSAPTKRSRSAISLVSVFVLILVITAVFTAVQYFDLAPAISSLIASAGTSSGLRETTTVPSESEISSNIGVIPPEISYKPTVFTVTSKGPLPLRKGPSDTYAQISAVPSGTLVQVTGGSLSSDIFVYAYIPSSDIYGWLSAAYLSESSALDAPTLPEKEETTAAEDKNETESTTESDIRKSAYKAKITAEKGLYLRVGPGTEFETIKVIKKDETVTVLEVCTANPDWLYVECENEKGYVNCAFVSKI